MNAYAVTITAPGPKSAFQDHHHSIGQVDGLEDALHALGLRITAIEDLLPAVNTAAQTDSVGESLEIEIPDRMELFPGKLADDTDVEAASKDPKKLPKPARARRRRRHQPRPQTRRGLVCSPPRPDNLEAGEKIPRSSLRPPGQHPRRGPQLHRSFHAGIQVYQYAGYYSAGKPSKRKSSDPAAPAVSGRIRLNFFFQHCAGLPSFPFCFSCSFPPLTISLPSPGWNADLQVVPLLRME